MRVRDAQYALLNHLGMHSMHPYDARNAHLGMHSMHPIKLDNKLENKDGESKRYIQSALR